MVNYGNGFIYKLCCRDTSIKDEYVGSSVDFTERKRCHKNDCNNPNSKKYNIYVYKFIRDNGGFENWSMIQIEKYPCENRRELETRERYWIETLESKLNSNIPTRTAKEYHKQYYEEKKDEVLEYNKQRYEEKKDEILEKNKEKITCECGCIVRKADISRHRKTQKHKKLLENKNEK
jgi:group I intron endonuclease